MDDRIIELVDLIRLFKLNVKLGQDIDNFRDGFGINFSSSCCYFTCMIILVVFKFH